MARFFGTFKQSSALNKAYVEVEDEDEKGAREALQLHFPNEWSMIYPIDKLQQQINDFNLWKYGEILIDGKVHNG